MWTEYTHPLVPDPAPRYGPSSGYNPTQARPTSQSHPFGPAQQVNPNLGYNPQPRSLTHAADPSVPSQYAPRSFSIALAAGGLLTLVGTFMPLLSVSMGAIKNASSAGAVAARSLGTFPDDGYFLLAFALLAVTGGVIGVLRSRLSPLWMILLALAGFVALYIEGHFFFASKSMVSSLNAISSSSPNKISATPALGFWMMLFGSFVAFYATAMIRAKRR